MLHIEQYGLYDDIWIYNKQYCFICRHMLPIALYESTCRHMESCSAIKTICQYMEPNCAVLFDMANIVYIAQYGYISTNGLLI